MANKTYTFKINYTTKKKSEKKNLKKIDISNNKINNCENCSICYKPYKSSEIVASCSDINLYKHNYHEKCLKKYFKYTPGLTYCPYCRKIILQTYSIIKKCNM